MSDNSHTGGVRRRGFLKSGSALGAAAAGGALGLGAAAEAGTRLMVDNLTDHEALTLLAMSRQLFPHDFLSDQYYATVVSDLDGQADDGETAALIKDGVGTLDRALGVRFVDLSPGYRLKVLRTLEQTPFFKLVKGSTVVSLYNNPLVWRHFGYEGEAYSHGGYINRGFDDLSWLPDPPEDASPPAA